MDDAIPVFIRPEGTLVGRVPSAMPVYLPLSGGTGQMKPSLADLLRLLDIKPEEVMLAFVNGECATLATPLLPSCRVTLSPFICGG
jgi:hypothetical protein